MVVVLDFYTSLVRQWTVLLLNHPSTTTTPGEALSTTFTSLIVHADLLCLSVLETLPPVLPTISSILSFYETLATSISHAPQNPNIRITTPSSEVIYRLAFATSLSTLSRLCSILSTHKTAFEAAMSRTEGNGYPREYVNHFNGFLMDICNCLWRNRALNREDANALGCLVPPAVLPALRTYADGLGHSLQRSSPYQTALPSARFL
jgi:centromere protein I